MSLWIETREILHMTFPCALIDDHVAFQLSFGHHRYDLVRSLTKLTELLKLQIL